ncbi:hypothetical protein [Bradyrhizobium japonicum]|uniref:hypothetical protein n=1 Tax=Bradyrhizobium japonicum TaxID=375 RepID=UPI0020121182|nr:hypothetical protein [Bradyrhizobium japonicum]
MKRADFSIAPWHRSPFCCGAGRLGVRRYLITGGEMLADDRAARFSAAEANAIKALSIAPNDAWLT